MIDIIDGETVTVTRVVRDGDTESSAAGGTIEQTVFGSSTVVEDTDMRGRRTVIERRWFCPRGSDVAAGDKIARSNGEVYQLIEGPLADENHALTGEDLGVCYFRTRRVSVPRG